MTTMRQRTSRTGAPRRSEMLRRLHTKLACGLVMLACALSALPAVSTAAAANTSHRVSATQELAVLLHDHRAHRSPRTSASLVASVPAQRPITGEQTTLPVIGQATSHGGTRWLKVMLPGRPNGLSGWIVKNGTRELVTDWHIVVNTSERLMWIYRHGRLARRFQVVVGKPSTPTPTGQFFIEETEKMPDTEAGGPFALALSARSNVLQEFSGGPGQIAIHGRNNLGGTLGSAVSHGCMRLDTAAISYLAARLGPGVPVTIHR